MIGGVQYGEQFSINQAGALVITDNEAAVVRGLLDQNLTEEVWSDLSASNPDLATRLSLGKDSCRPNRCIDGI